MTDDQIKKIQTEFTFDVVIMIIIVYLLELSRWYQDSCGIPIKEWLIGFTIIYFSRSTWQLIKIWVLTNFYEYKTWYDIMAFTVSNGVLVGWLIYGFVIFYSDANNCERVNDTSFLNSMMFVILFVGYVMTFVYIMLLCTVPCMYLFIRENAE